MKNSIQSHKELVVWSKSMELVEKIYKITKNFPKEELYGLTSQIRRATIAIPSNIAEGYQRNHMKEYIQFLYVAKSSASELETLLDISIRLRLIPDETMNRSIILLDEILKMLTIMISKLKFRLRCTKP